MRNLKQVKLISFTLFLIAISFSFDSLAFESSGEPGSDVEYEESERRNLALCMNTQVWTCIVGGLPNNPCAWNGSGCN